MTRNDHNIILLASFPKSGNTWVRFILSNVFNELDPSFDEIDFFNVHNIVPKLGGEISPYFEKFPQIYTTHDKHSSEYSSAVLIIRNPWDTLYSYYHYLKGERKLNITLKEVVYHPSFGINAIVEHTNSYFDNCKSLLAITYENLNERVYEEVDKLCAFLSLNVSKKVLQSAIQRSSFESMRDIETRKGRKFGNSEFVFTRSGVCGEGVTAMRQNDELNEFIKEECFKSPQLVSCYL